MEYAAICRFCRNFLCELESVKKKAVPNLTLIDSGFLSFLSYLAKCLNCYKCTYKNMHIRVIVLKYRKNSFGFN